MNELVFFQKDEVLTDSLSVAEYFHKQHKDVIRKIENIIDEDSAQNCAQCFKKSHYKDLSGKTNIKYLMNRDGFTFLVMGFTGKKANQWKWDYIKAFNSMEAVIREKSTTIWIETRQQGKLTRKAETDVIKELVEYAKDQGSKHSQMLYMTYSKLANAMAGVTKRDNASVMQLNNLSIFENIILTIIRNGMNEGLGYKEIYQVCKLRCEQAKEIAMIK
jgi:Rha family phage regulatory protein